MDSKIVKRKHKTLSLPEKWEIIQRYDRGETPTHISSIYGIARPTVYDIMKSREKIEHFVKSTDDITRRKTLKSSEYPQVEEALYAWFKQESNRHAPISGNILKEKAHFFYREITTKEDFRASGGWFENFKKRHGIRFLGGEKLSADDSEMSKFIKNFNAKITELGLTPEQVYNADETDLNWRQLPTSTFASINEQNISVRKLPKERLTLMVCANSAGSHMLKLLAVAKNKHSMAFKNIKMESLPVVYKNQRQALLTREIFRDWFFNHFVPEVELHLKVNKLPLKALLLLDNAPAHSDLEELRVKTAEGYIEVMYLPKNSTGLIQPMDQNVIKTLKAHYKKRLIMDAVCQPESKTNSFLKTCHIKGAILNAAYAWKQVKPRTLITSWKNIWPENPFLQKHSGENDATQDYNDVVDDTLTLCEESNIPQEASEDLRRWVIDDNLGSELTDEEIIQEVTSGEKVEKIEEAAEAKYTISSNEDLVAADTDLLTTKNISPDIDMAACDPRMFQFHGNLPPNMMPNINQMRYSTQTSNPGLGQPVQGNTPRQNGQPPSDQKVSAGPGWENIYRTAQNICFPETKVACGNIVGDYLEDLARGIGCPVEYVLVPLLPCIGGLLGTNTTIKVHKAWTEPPVVWSMVGAGGGTRRSAVIRQLLGPILELQAQKETQERQLGNQHSNERCEKTSTEQRRALYSGSRVTQAALTEVLNRNDGHAFSLTENLEHFQDMLMQQPTGSSRLVSDMEDLYEGLPQVAIEDGRVSKLLGSNFCYGGFARPEYLVTTMLKSPSWLSARLLLSCPQSDDMKGVFGEPTDLETSDLESIYSALFDYHQVKRQYTFHSEALRNLSQFFEEEWSTVLNQLDQNEHEGIIGKSMGQIVRLCGILKAFENAILCARAKEEEKEDFEWDWTIGADIVKCGIALGKYFIEEKLAMTFMVSTGFFNHSSDMDSSMNGTNESATTLPQTAIQENHFKPSLFPNIHPSTSAISDSGPLNTDSGSPRQGLQTRSSSFSLAKQPGDVDFSNLPHALTTAEEDVSEMMQAVDFVHLNKTQFVAVHGRRIKRLLECYDDGHGVSATTAAQKSITPPVRIEGTNNRHPAWASALFFQKVADLELGIAEQGRHPTNRKICWRFKRKPISQLQEKDFQLLQYLRVEMDKYSQFGSASFNPSVMVNSGLLTLPKNSSPNSQTPGISSPRMDDDSNSQNSTINIKNEIY
ncbi:uncharacterized protein LOC106072531 [Biomphalaria glabrata]|uniref:Uncharacterized protein LOC106072531 n=1 Tax=Biomphalaria glabrata TaxID=6526 RepID=A0A9W2Z357_BIOGL|nr:uncharacterized protein LOC106072531 [Biomphalaria glabrata]